MSDKLSDDRLTRLLAERPGRALTDAELKHIANRVADSSTLQKALLDRAVVDERIAKQLADTQLPLQVFVANATPVKTTLPSQLRNAAIGLGTACFLIGVATAYLLLSESDTTPPLAQVANPRAIEQDPELVVTSVGGPKFVGDEKQSPKLAGPNPSSDPKAPRPVTPVESNPVPATAPAGVPTIPDIVRLDAKPPWTVALSEKPRAFEEVAYQPQVLDGLDANDLREWLAPVSKLAYRVERRSHGNRPFSRFTGVAQLRPTWPKDGVLRLGIYPPSDIRFHFWAGDEGVTFRYVPTVQTWLAFRSFRENESALPERFALVASDEGRHQRTRLGVIEIRHQGQHVILSRGDVVLIAAPMPAPPTQVVLDGSTYVSQLKMYRSTPLPYRPEIDADRLVRNIERPSDLEWFVASTKPDSDPVEPLRQVIREAGKPEQVEEPRGDDKNEDKPKARQPEPWRVEFTDTNQLVGHASGAVELAVEFNPAELQAATFLNTDRSSHSLLNEICFRVDHADVGTGIFLGDEFGKPIERLGFYEERTTGLIIVGHRPAGNNTTAVTYNPTSQRITAIAAGSWVRIGIGLGGLKLWVSGDGMHWSRALSSPIRTVFTRPATFGLYALPGNKRRRLQLAQLQIRELTGLTQLASAKTRQRVPSLPLDEQSSLADWLHHSLQSQPSGVDTEEWTRACAIRAIEQNASRHLTATLLDRLMDQTIKSPLEPDAAKGMLDDFALFSDGWDQLGTAIAARYHQWGQQLASRQDNSAFEDTARNLITAPIWTNVKLPIIEHPLLHTTLLSRIYNQDWMAVRHACERMRFWQQSSHPDESWTQTSSQQRQIVEWAEAIAWSHLRNREDAAELAKTSSTPPPANLMDRWQQPLVWDMSKEAYNLMAEFESALKSEAWQDAAQIIGTAASEPQNFTADEDVLLGLLPDWSQPNLLVALPVAVELAVKQYRGLRNVMREELGPRGMLRVQQSIESGNAQDVETATLQYYGTPAAALAHEWLGDRAISLGKFEVAVREYRRAIPEASPAVVQSLQSRLRLAFALAGQSAAVEGTEEMPLPAPQEAVVLGESSMTGQSFMSLVTDISNNASDPTSGLTSTSVDPTSAPMLADYKAEVIDTFNGNMGRSPGQSGYQVTDWAGRQLAVTTDNDLMVVSNRFQIASFDLKTGKKRNAWTMAKPATTHDWTLLPMKPLIAGDRIYVRWLEQSSPQLACLDRNSNTVVWAKKADGYIASDPVILGGKLKAVVAKSLGNSIVRFDLATFDPSTGDITELRPFVRQRDKWAMKPNIHVLVHDGRLLCSFDSLLVSLDEDGTPRWLNQQTWLPREIDANWIHRSHSPILVRDNLVFVVQSASRQLSCFDASTGRQEWTVGLPDIRRMIGLSGSRIVVETDAGFAAFSAKRGRLQWTLDVPADQRLHAVASDSNSFVFGRRVNNGAKGSTAALVWVDGESGTIQRTVTLAGLANPKHSLFLGPLVMAGENAWTFFGTEWNKPERQLVRLNRIDTNQPVAPLGITRAAGSDWIDSTENSRINVQQVVGDWTLATRQSVSGQFDGAEVVGDFRGEKNALHTRMIQGHAVRLARRIDVPKTGRTSLEIRAGHVAGNRWVLTVEAAGKQLTRTAIDDTSAPSGWKQLRLDLTRFAGKSIWLGVSQQADEADKQKPNDAYWKRLAIVRN